MRTAHARCVPPPVAEPAIATKSFGAPERPAGIDDNQPMTDSRHITEIPARLSEHDSILRIRQACDEIETANDREGIADAVERLADDGPSLHTPLFSHFIKVLFGLPLALAGLAACVFAGLLWYEIGTNDPLRQSMDWGLLFVVGSVSFAMACITIALFRFTRVHWTLFRMNREWFGNLRALCGERLGDHLMRRHRPDCDGDRLWRAWNRRFNDFNRGHKNQTIAAVDSIEWPSADDDERIGSQRAWVYAFFYTKVHKRTETDSDGYSRTETYETNHWRYGVVLPFRQYGWLHIRPRGFGRGIWRPLHPALDAAMRVDAHEPEVPARVLKPQVELAIEALTRHFSGLDIEMAENQLRISFDDSAITDMPMQADTLRDLASAARSARIPESVRRLQDFTEALRRANRYAGREAASA